MWRAGLVKLWAVGLVVGLGLGAGLTLAADKLPDGLYARMETSRGVIVAKLYYQAAPITVANFVMLADGTGHWRGRDGQLKQSHYFDNTVFHRVVPGFVIQGGDPTATGAGGPGYDFMDEFSVDLKHNQAGVLSMANRGPGTNGSQFFITHVPTPWLDGRHPIFGQVVQGMDVVLAVQVGDVLRKVTIVRQGKAAQDWDAKAAAQAKIKNLHWDKAPLL